MPFVLKACTYFFVLCITAYYRQFCLLYTFSKDYFYIVSLFTILLSRKGPDCHAHEIALAGRELDSDWFNSHCTMTLICLHIYPTG